MTPVEQLLLPRPRRVDLEPNRLVVQQSELCSTVDLSLPAQGYRLTIDSNGSLSVAAADAAGRFYAERTLAQLRDDTGRLPVGTIEDWPDLTVRAVMLDVSRTKVPTLETLFELTDRLSSWKLNQLQLYIEHTFAYPGHEAVWEAADPFTAADLEKLRAYCTERHVELVANQNTLGHMERWLMHPDYSQLGIARGVVRGPMGVPMPASTLDPANPDALLLVRQLIGVLGEVLPGGLLHVGMDEPWDLPTERAGEWAGWLGQLRRLSETKGRELLVWGDMPARHAELLGSVADGVTVCEWGYEENHPFDSRLAALCDAGVPHWVCPGTSSWLSILGRTTNAVENCRSAAGAAVSFHSDGMLVTDWGDFGHLQHLPVSDPGLAAAAAFSWCFESNRSLDTSTLAEVLDRRCYGDAAGRLGSAVVALGDVHRLLPVQLPNISALVLHLYFPQLPVSEAAYRGISPAAFDSVSSAIDDAVSALAGSRPENEHGRRAVDELITSARLVQLCCDDAKGRLNGDGTLASLSTATRAELEGRLEELIVEQHRLWLRRNRPAGLEESLAWLRHLGHCYRQGTADDDWAGPLVARVRASRVP
ncbi:MAG TPA: family 20 glycosylhydrolase [Acidimicrobiales bacterium]|nr:family 20 glycosylhydrolase [Acidimicrobiales bacterium]